ncbi:hypothetical protein DFH27DRAFT_550465 [Peziza echinospora]|nr:hypothetical protein DFH27DRAFT_550465 [Peziza echinospora]
MRTIPSLIDILNLTTKLKGRYRYRCRYPIAKLPFDQISISSLAHGGGTTLNKPRKATSTLARTSTSLKLPLSPQIPRPHHSNPRNTSLSPRRRFTTSAPKRNTVSETILSLHPALLSPIVFIGLLGSLWGYKCLMMILFQDRIIYMPGMPPGARRETISDYTSQCGGISWREERINVHHELGLKRWFGLRKGVELACAVAEGRVERGAPAPPGKQRDEVAVRPRKKRNVVVMYLQGNGSSTPPRLPYLSSTLKSLLATTAEISESNDIDQVDITYTFLVPSYRGYWTSSGPHPRQSTIEKDMAGVYRYLLRRGWEKPKADGKEFKEEEEEVRYIFWGQSIGSNILVTTLSQNLDVIHGHGHSKEPVTAKANRARIPALLILETPFISIADMLLEMYPQKWLPYRYLSPFLWNLWDMNKALAAIDGRAMGKVLVLRAENDELVSSVQGEKVVQVLKETFGDNEGRVEDVLVQGALHVQCMEKGKGRGAVVRAIREVAIGGEQAYKSEQ